MDAFEFHPHPAEFAPVNPNTCQDIAVSLLKWIGVVLVSCVVWAALAGPARADDQGVSHSQHAMQHASEADNAESEASGHPPAHQQLHVLFYSSWMRLDTGTSCCNTTDCFPTIMMQGADGSWWALKQHAVVELENLVAADKPAPIPPIGDLSRWIRVPEDRLEHNSQRRDLGVTFPRDERPSPDGRSHACINGGFVLCAVIGGGM